MRVKTPYQLFTNANARTFAVRVVPAGARYGKGNALVDRQHTLVEFYDAMYADDGADDDTGFGPLGQFVSRYRIGTIMGHDQEHGTGGLTLDGGVAVWSIDAGTMAKVRLWLVTYDSEEEQYGVYATLARTNGVQSAARQIQALGAGRTDVERWQKRYEAATEASDA